MKIVLSPNPYRDKGLKAAQAAQRVLREAGAETCMSLPFSLEKGSGLELPAHLKFVSMEEAFQGADLLVCFGGDGTILHAAKDADAHHIPVLGVNLGSVGFMAELEVSELGELSRLTKGEYALEERMMLDVSIRREGRTIFRDLALNDAVITKGAVARISSLPPSVPMPSTPGPLCWIGAVWWRCGWESSPARPPICPWTAARPSGLEGAIRWSCAAPDPRPGWPS